MTKPFAKRGARPLNEKPDLARTLVKSLLKVSKDKRFTIDKMKSTTVLRKVFADDEVPFEKLCMKAISSNKNENENVNDLELAVIKVPAACDLGAANGPINHFKETILPKMIAGEGDFQFNNEDEKAAILAVLELEIEDETIIDLKTNAPLKTAAEKLRDREQQPEKKDKRREYNQRDDVKAKKREYEQRDDVKAKKREYDQEYNQRPDVKEKKSAYAQEYYEYYTKERIRLSLREQLRIPPPISSIGGKCTICARTRSVGWKSALKFCSQIEKYFENEGFPEPQGADKTRRFLNHEKTRRGRQRKEEKGGVSSEIDFAHVMCLNCVRKYERSAKMRLDIIRLSAVAAVSVAN
ncbi:unknown protein [Bathycoccus prasinos]|uniref:Uncharacterized protein n=1 Tax=Bathycoccus prasinos TaxID=41875 RepID=K8E9J1_9CHLO|nr:unknown protein [Bathycoccus prasinos]CCO14392.1 unknown protein [Bathycoccus prasinos]|eukprot:XP_007515513.1 unknown protein [Bathycoccus prasinos]